MTITDGFEDTFEKLVEQGASQTKKVVKSAAQQVKQVASPSKLWEQLLGASPNHPDLPDSPDKRPGKTHTPLDFDKLGKAYQNNERQKEEQLKQRLFQLVKQGEEKVLYEKKKEEEEKKRKEYYEAMEKKKKEEEEKKQQQMAEIPQGKVRRSIFSPRKVAERQHSEFKPATGKQ